MRESLPLIDNLITYVYQAINSLPSSVAPRSLGHHWDSHMRAASIKLVQAGQTSVCYAAVKWLSRVDTYLNGTPSATSCSLMMQRQEGTHTNVGQKDLAMEVSGVWDCYHQSWQSLCTFTVRFWMSFRKSVWRKGLNNSYNFLRICL